MPTPYCAAGNSDHEPVSSTNGCLKWPQRSNQMQTFWRANDILISWLTMQVQHKPHLLSFAKKHVWCVDMASRILLLFCNLWIKSFFASVYFWKKECGALGDECLSRHRFKEWQFIFDDILMRSFWGAWTCDCQTYMSLVSNIFVRWYVRAGQQNANGTTIPSCIQWRCQGKCCCHTCNWT